MTQLTPGELEVMKILWEHDSLKPAEILAKMDRPLSDAALRSVLRVLLHKGQTKRKKTGRAFFYSASKKSEGTFKTMTRRLADAFCRGSSLGLIARLLEEEQFSEEEVEQLQQLAKKASQQKTTSERRKSK